MLKGKDIQFWRPLLREWAKEAGVPINGIDVEVRGLRAEYRRGHGWFRPISHWHKPHALITLWFRTDYPEHARWIWVHELGHLKDWRRGKGFHQGRADKFALRVCGACPEGYQIAKGKSYRGASNG